MWATSSAVNADATSSLGSTPNRRTSALDSQSMTWMTGATTLDTMTSGGTRRTAARSGRAIEMFFGIISP